MKSISDGFNYKGKTKSSDTGLLFIVAVFSSQSTVVMLDKQNITLHNVTLLLMNTNNYYY